MITIVIIIILLFNAITLGFILFFWLFDKNRIRKIPIPPKNLKNKNK